MILVDDVDFRHTLSPAQSLSAEARRWFTFSWNGYSKAVSMVFSKYLVSLFSFSMSPSVRDCTQRDSSLASYCTSGRSPAAYCRMPTAVRYRLWSLELSASNALRAVRPVSLVPGVTAPFAPRSPSNSTKASV